MKALRVAPLTLVLVVGGLFLVNRLVFAAPDLASQVAKARPEVPGSFRVLTELPWREGTITFYTVGRYRAAPPSTNGPTYTTLGVAFYQDPGAFHFKVLNLWEDSNRVDRNIELFFNSHDELTLTAGRVLDPRVTALEVRYDNGQTARLPVHPGGFFALVAEHGERALLDGVEFTGQKEQNRQR
jgi:hypothetical protein